MDVSDLIPGLLRDDVRTLLLPLFVGKSLDGLGTRGVDLGVKLIASTFKGQLDLVHRHGSREILLTVHCLVDPGSVHRHKLITFPDINTEPVRWRIRQDPGNLVWGGVVEKDSSGVGTDPGLVLLFGTVGGESQMRRIQLTEEIGNKGAQVGSCPHIGKKRSIVIPDRGPVRPMEIDVIVILLKHSPCLIEHLPELVAQHYFHVFLDLSLGCRARCRVNFVNGSARKAVQRIRGIEERPAHKVLDLLWFSLRVRNLQRKDTR